jgi:hypothetical protein
VTFTESVCGPFKGNQKAVVHGWSREDR